MDCCAHEGPGGGDARFDIKKVADGVYAAVASPAYKVNCNTAIIENADGVMVVDTHSKPSAAKVIIERLREMTKKPVRYVVNTHFHWDHWHGNEVYPAAYPDAEIVTNQITREAMVKKGLKRIQDHVRQVPAEIAKLKADIAGGGSPAQRGKLEADLKPRRVLSGRGSRAQAGAADDRLREDDEALPARPRDPSAASRPRPHRG